MEAAKMSWLQWLMVGLWGRPVFYKPVPEAGVQKRKSHKDSSISNKKMEVTGKTRKCCPLESP